MGKGMEWGLGVSGVQFDTIPDESSNGTMIGITRMKMPSAASASLQGVGAHSKALRKKFCRANALAAAVRPLANAVRPLARAVRPLARAVRGLAARGEKFVRGVARGRILYVSRR